MLPNDFVVFWEHDSFMCRYSLQPDGSYHISMRAHGEWVKQHRIQYDVAARAFHEAESVYALVDRSQPKVEALPPIPGCVSWSDAQGNFYDSNSHVGMGLQFFYTWHHRRAEFPQGDVFRCEIKQ